MHTAARHQAVIELLEEILKSKAPADRLIGDYFRARRYIGAKDRGAIATDTYSVLRLYERLTWRLAGRGQPVTARLLYLDYLTHEGNQEMQTVMHWWNGAQYAPQPLDDNESRYHNGFDLPLTPHAEYALPEWLYQAFTTTYGHDAPQLMQALQQQAPLDLRVNTLKTSRDKALAILAASEITATPLPHSENALRITSRAPIFGLKAFQDGWFEVQDAASQVMSNLVAAKAGEHILDFCAGAGGKTLAIAAAMQNKGQIIALDIAAGKLKELKKRAKRAGVENTQTHAISGLDDAYFRRLKANMDAVLVDAPCSGTGTLRRSPDITLRLTPARVAELITLQRTILEKAATCVKPKGRLIYVTCSLLAEENTEQVEWFIKNFPEFSLKESRLLTPNNNQTDGLFGAVLIKNMNDAPPG
jgi:16S rRNA (cytosine967-C5)-methyltransferase